MPAHKANYEELINKIFGWLTVLEYAGKDNKGYPSYICFCSGCKRNVQIMRQNLVKENYTKCCYECGKLIAGIKGRKAYNLRHKNRFASKIVETM